ncbi:PREDICTED: peptide deformylase, mitochondrial-like [Habropoda laboriosa]|uniref:peptide deformylase, mitochondrial-like n=1 Tax=Habropoda laboriosa TaxID=597456 RepID=UPI00083D02BF|nr:PREDICTED: peptide deformylase, mitochondrial-like [Habropoda laboriosa]
MLRYSDIISRCVIGMQKSGTRLLSFASVKDSFSISFKEISEILKPPKINVCYIGNPVLRQKTTPVDLKTVETQEFQKILHNLHKVLRKSGTVGLSAPQLGLSWQLFALEITEQSLKELHPYYRKYNIEPFPLTYFINPKIKIINPEKTVCYEMCGSIPYYCAQVPRAKEIQIEAFNRLGEPFRFKAKDVLARIAQHEMDHLQGILYIDKMLPDTFKFYDPKYMK